ncbi:MAG: SDR family NAD(P)-dependent oxidoreductase [Ignavibacteria bacterium]|nr:SDR family NAD(P)-dependent oxidoreductase [Ignavibacteria bacterium]
MDLKEFYRGKKVFVTGAGGFIGSHVVEELVMNGAEVTALVHYNASSYINNLRFVPEEILSKVDIKFGDVTDAFQMQTLTKDSDIILHLAALIGIPYSYAAPAAYVSANINGTLNLLEAARNNSISKIVVTSTSETYGTAIYTPIDEKHPMQGQSPYSATKIGADKLAESYYLSFNLPVCIFRPFNTFGPRQSMRAVIPTIITQALNSKEIKLGSLSPVRDMVFVKDTARGFLMAGMEEKSTGEVISVGTGAGATVGEIAEMILQILGSDKKIVEDSQRVRPEKSEVFKLICDNRKAKELLNWSPQYSLEEGLREAISFIQKNINSYEADKYTV